LLDRDGIIAAARAAGVVGARNGMPTHTRLAESAEIVIANACECEPLVYSDRHLIFNHAADIIAGLDLAMTATGARRGIIAYVEDDPDLDAIIRREIAEHPGIEVFQAPDFYPVSESHTLTYEATGRVAPNSAATEAVGVSVFNVETLHNLSLAARGGPVTHRTLTVAGEVVRPTVTRMPLGARIEDAIARAGGAAVKSFRVLLGGPVSGYVEDDISAPITKVTPAVLVLPTQHVQVQKRVRSLAVMLLRARSACFQCRDCTDHCTRYLLGQEIEPHKIMRAICHSVDNLSTSITSAVNCAECGVCDSFVCKMGISPKLICRHIKSHLQAMGWQIRPETNPPSPRHDYAAGHISVADLIARLRITEYVAAIDLPGILHAQTGPDLLPPRSLAVPLLQHIGSPALPAVRKGDSVSPGQVIGEIPEGKLGARIHTALGGTVATIGQEIRINGNAG